MSYGMGVAGDHLLVRWNDTKAPFLTSFPIDMELGGSRSVVRSEPDGFLLFLPLKNMIEGW